MLYSTNYILEKTIILQRQIIALASLLRLTLKLLLPLPFRFTLQLILATNSNILGTEVTEQCLEHVLDNPAASVVADHQDGEHTLEFRAERDQTQLLVYLGDELGRARECHRRCGHETPVHGLVLADGLPERSPLVVDGKRGDLLNELQQINGAVEERWLEFAFEVKIGFAPGRVLERDHGDG